MYNIYVYTTGSEKHLWIVQKLGPHFLLTKQRAVPTELKISPSVSTSQLNRELWNLKRRRKRKKQLHIFYLTIKFILGTRKYCQTTKCPSQIPISHKYNMLTCSRYGWQEPMCIEWFWIPNIKTRTSSTWTRHDFTHF